MMESLKFYCLLFDKISISFESVYIYEFGDLIFIYFITEVIY